MPEIIYKGKEILAILNAGLSAKGLCPRLAADESWHTCLRVVDNEFEVATYTQKKEPEPEPRAKEPGLIKRMVSFGGDIKK